MKHGDGKSGSAIVAVMLTNKAEQSAAEPVEPRAEAKGNAGQQSTLRTQSRASVSQALERIRQVAKQGKKAEKFTTLLHHVSSDLLKTAFHQLKEGAAPGWMGLHGRTTRQTSTTISRICMHGSIRERIGHCRHDAST